MKRFHFFAVHRYPLCILSIFVHQKVYLIVIFFKKKVSFSEVNVKSKCENFIIYFF